MFQGIIKGIFERENFIFILLVVLFYLILILSVIFRIIESAYYNFVKREDKKVEINLI